MCACSFCCFSISWFQGLGQALAFSAGRGSLSRSSALRIYMGYADTMRVPH